MKEFFKELLDLCKFTFGIVIVLLIVFSVAYFVNDISTSYDDSDAPNERSGFTVMTDYKTGLQYLKSGNALTPRLDVNGKQIIKDGE